MNNEKHEKDHSLVPFVPSCEKQLPVLFFEFLRYILVGGIACVVDFSVLYVCREFIFQTTPYGLYIATACGIIVGLIVNYTLSLCFVFTQAKDRGKGRSVGAFCVFGGVGFVGLALTEAGMWAGVEVLNVNYLIVKLGVTGVVLFWNYLGRKVLIFR